MIKFKQILFKFRTHKKLTVILLIMSLFLLICVGGFFWSQKVWSDYDIRYNKHFDDIKININNTISQVTTESTSVYSEKLDILINMQTKLIDDIDVHCKINPIIKWQSFIGQYREKIDNCESQKVKINQFLSKLSLVTDYLKSEHQLASIISIANEKTNQNNQADKWELIESFWRQTIIDINNLSDIEQFNTVKIIVTEKITTMADIWKQLSDANKAQDMEDFQNTNNELIKVYDSITEISNVSKLQTEKLFADLNDSYEKLY